LAINSYPAWGHYFTANRQSNCKPISPRSDSQIAALMATFMPICTCQLAQKDAATITQWEWHKFWVAGGARAAWARREQNRNCNWS